YALSMNSKVKRALFTSPLVAKTRVLGATPVVAITRINVATPATAPNKVSSASSLTPESRHVRTLIEYMKTKIETSNLKLLKHFIEKFMGTVRFGNDHFAAITGYDNYVQENITIFRVYYVEGLGHNLFSVGQ
ncbi:hypothetical protein Tco_1353520, partial [Tanacetum coccineum]